MLEWGHDWIVVETSLAVLAPVGRDPLEWGHDWIVVETIWCFRAQNKIDLLEWGHDWIVVETLGMAHPDVPTVTA